MRVNLIRYGSGSGSDQGVQWASTLTTNGSIHILCCKTLLKTFFPVRISTILAILEPILNREGSTALTLNPFIQLNHRSRFLLPFIFSFFVAPYVYVSYPFLIHQSFLSYWLRPHPLLIQANLNLFYLPLYYTMFTSIAYISIPRINYWSRSTSITRISSSQFFAVYILLGQVAPLPLSIDLLGILWSRKRT